MKHSIFTRLVSATAILISVGLAPSAEARMGKALNDTAQVGFNALDYVLQRPLGSPVYQNKRFGDHFFINAGIGFDDYNQMVNSAFRPGIQAELSFGDWITPVHGWRLNFNGGTHSKRNTGRWKTFGAVSADYIMNFSSLLRGDNPSRKVEILGALGAQIERMHYAGAWGNELGLRAGLQARFNLQRDLYMYVEPRLTLLAGTRFSGDGIRRFRPDASVYVGLGYRLRSKAERMAFPATPFIGTVDSHLFFGAGGGIWTFARQVGDLRNNPKAFGSFYVGKYFSPTAGVRVQAEFGRFGKITPNRHRYLANGDLDFVWNMSSAFGGYRPNQVFDLSLNLGPTIAYSNRADSKFHLGAGASLTALFRLSHNWGLYLEPAVKMFSTEFNNLVRAGGRGPLVSVMAGVRYTTGNFKYEHAKSYEDFLTAKNSFLTFAFAPAQRWRGNYGKGYAGQIGFGRRFTPISSWRVTAEGEVFNHAPTFMALTANLDYLFSISTAMAGFNPDRVFDLSGLVGVTAGIGQYNRPVNLLGGGRVGLHGDFRLSKNLDLYLEPQLVGTMMRGAGNPSWSPEARLMIGLKYKLNTPDDALRGLENTPMSESRNFVSFAGGPSAFYPYFTRSPHKASGSLDIAVGRWFSQISAGRVGYTLDIVGNRNGSKRPVLSTLHLDYLFDISSMMNRDAERRFRVLGIVGTGLGFSNLSNSKASPIITIGTQFRYALPQNFDLHIEPNAEFMPNRMSRGYESMAKFTVMARIMAGVSYRFH